LDILNFSVQSFTKHFPQKGVLFVFKYIKIPRLKVCPQMAMLIIKEKKSVKEGYYISPLIVWFAGSDIIIRLLFKN